MLDLLALDLVEKGLVTYQIVLTIGYDKDIEYHGEMMIDRYNRKIPKHAHGTIHIDRYTSSSKLSLVNVYSIIIHLSLAIYLNIVLLRLVTEKIDRPICSCMDANTETTGSCIETFLVS